MEAGTKTSLSQLTEKLNSAQALNDKLNDSLKKSQLDVLNVGDLDFDKAKEQILCLHPILDLYELDFFKVVKDDPLVDLEEAKTNLIGSYGDKNDVDKGNLIPKNKYFGL